MSIDQPSHKRIATPNPNWLALALDDQFDEKVQDINTLHRQAPDWPSREHR